MLITPESDATRALLCSWEALVRLLGIAAADQVSLCLQHLRVAEALGDLATFGMLVVPDPDRPDHGRVSLDHGGVLVVRTNNGKKCGPKTSELSVIAVERNQS